MVLPSSLQRIIDDLSRQDAVEALVLGGSRAGNGNPDTSSDYDVYVYLSEELSVDRRRQILAREMSVLELNNQFWETEDDGVLNDGTAVEFLYRDLRVTTVRLEEVVEQCRASLGYTTCLWENVIEGQVLYDRRGQMKALQGRFGVNYPLPLAQAIVAKNWPLVGDATCSYRHQIAQALTRRDWISVQHRIAALVASVFDLVFAAQLTRHPGEKRLLERSLKLPSLPAGFATLVGALAGPEPSRADQVLGQVDALGAALGDWLSDLGFLPNRPRKPQAEAPSKASTLTVYTDGGCIGNPGKGAWAYLIDDGVQVVEASAGESMTTNNRMELQAVISALQAIAQKHGSRAPEVVVHTDSQYVRNGITAWIKSWEANGWKTAAKEPVKNKELWIELQKWDKAVKPVWKWVKGHAGNPRNERCDALVRQTMDSL